MTLLRGICRFVDKLEIPIKALTIALYVLEAVAIAFFLVAVYLPHVPAPGNINV